MFGGLLGLPLDYPCKYGSKIAWIGKWGPAQIGSGATAEPKNLCLEPWRAPWLQAVLVAEDDAHFARIQALLDVTKRVRSSDNGVVDGAPQPLHILTGPLHEGGGQSSSGAFYINVDDLRQVNPLAAPTNIGAVGLDTLTTATHEYFHQFQVAWKRLHPETIDHVQFGTEGMTTSVELNLCSKEFPGSYQLPDSDLRKSECISAGKLGKADRGRYLPLLLEKPFLNALTQPYASALFFGYMQEQFGWPRGQQPLIGGTPHPSGKDSSWQRPSNADILTLANRKWSGEGVDFISLLYTRFSTPVLGGYPVGSNPPTKKASVSTSNYFDLTLNESLGRSLREVTRDFHAALVLKDYNETDARWRFQWTHGDGYFAKTRLSDAKPFEPPDNLIDATCNLQGVCDGLVRATRVLDAWAPGSPPTHVPFPVGSGVQSKQATGIGAHGAAFLSVAPDPSWAQANKKVWFQADVISGKPLPDFRIFRVQLKLIGTKLRLVPEALCGDYEDYVCPLVQLASGRFFLGFSVAVDALTSEIIVVASAREAPANFTWAFGEADTKTTILDPTEAVPAYIGSKDFPGKLLIKVSRRDADGHPISDAPGTVEVNLIAPPGTGGGCNLQLAKKELTLWPLSGGNLFIIASPPASCYPASGSALFDLEVVADGDSDIAKQAVSIKPGARREAVVVAIGKSAKMAGEKLASAKEVAKAIFRSLAPPAGAPSLTWGGLVSFNQDADTNFDVQLISPDAPPFIDSVIDTITASGQSSLGDGCLESEYLLAKTFDPVWKTSWFPDRVSIVLISDGVSMAHTEPRFFYFEPDAPDHDDNSSWMPGLSLPKRRDNDLFTPVVSSVAVGNDADLSDLDRLARETGGTLVHVANTKSYAAMVVAAADSSMQAVASAVGHERVVSAATSGGGTTEAWVETGARELRANVVSAEAQAGRGKLVSPSGTEVTPIAVEPEGKSTSFRVVDPEPGRWRIVTPEAPEPQGQVFVEATVGGPIRLFSTLDAADVLPLSAPRGQGERLAGLEAWMGSDLHLRAAVMDAGPLAECQVTARLALPDGGTTELPLFDDGEHEDRQAGDGIFGALFTRTAEAGPYSARIRARCALQSGGEVRREQLLTAFIRPLPDLDEAGVPARWKAQYGLAAQPLGDADADGMPDIDEFVYGTNPIASDSDGGGESDLSETLAGRDPRDAGDDLASVPDLVPVAGNSLVYLPAPLTGNGIQLHVQRAPSLAGPFETISVETSERPRHAVDRTSTNGALACYRMRAETPTASSGWSEPACVTPRLDPVPPWVRLVVGSALTHTRDVELSLWAGDSSFEGDAAPPPVELGAVESGVESIRWWFGAGPPDGIQWQPVTQSIALRLPDAAGTLVQVQARDAAGNSSRPATVVFSRALRTPLDHAIAAEERAEDRLAEGRLSDAVSEITGSLAFIEESFTASVIRLSNSQGKNPDEVRVLTTLAGVRADKLAALGLMKPKTQAQARAKLESALKQEIELARFAHERGIEL